MTPDMVRAAFGEQVLPVPVWFMRQAGRFLPEYRDLRSRHGFVELMSTPNLAAEVSMQPVRRFDLDASIIFSDILVVLQGMGVPIRFEPGPILPKFDLDDRGNLTKFNIETIRWQYDAIAEVRARLSSQKTMIGFTGGAFTLAAYLTGRSKDDFATTRQLMKQDRAGFADLLKRIADATAEHLVQQARAGANILMVFDSWASILSPSTFDTQVRQTTRSMLSQIRGRTNKPVIYFINGMAHLLDFISDFPVHVIGVDHRTPMDLAVKKLGKKFSLQGNLDPTDLFLPRELLAKRIDTVLNQARHARSHIFNLGHGVLPGTPLDAVEFLVQKIRSHG